MIITPSLDKYPKYFKVDNNWTQSGIEATTIILWSTRSTTLPTGYVINFSLDFDFFKFILISINTSHFVKIIVMFMFANNFLGIKI